MLEFFLGAVALSLFIPAVYLHGKAAGIRETTRMFNTGRWT